MEWLSVSCIVYPLNGEFCGKLSVKLYASSNAISAIITLVNISATCCQYPFSLGAGCIRPEAVGSTTFVSDSVFIGKGNHIRQSVVLISCEYYVFIYLGALVSAREYRKTDPLLGGIIIRTFSPHLMIALQSTPHPSIACAECPAR